MAASELHRPPSPLGVSCREGPRAKCLPVSLGPSTPRAPQPHTTGRASLRHATVAGNSPWRRHAGGLASFAAPGTPSPLRPTAHRGRTTPMTNTTVPTRADSMLAWRRHKPMLYVPVRRDRWGATAQGPELPGEPCARPIGPGSKQRRTMAPCAAGLDTPPVEEGDPFVVRRLLPEL